MGADDIHSFLRRFLEASRKWMRPKGGRLLPAASIGLVLALCATLTACMGPFLSAPAARAVPLGAFLGSDARGVRNIKPFQEWLGSPVDVGHTYMPGEGWSGIEGPDEILKPWARWKVANPDKLLVINIPMMAANERGLGDGTVASLLRAGASGAFDKHYLRFARRLAGEGVKDAIIVPGWEMNGITYSGRCRPDPAAWKVYWRRIVTTMRSVPGISLRFDFTATRGPDAIPWPDCYPGDDVVDIIGSDSYDQPAGKSFDYYINEPYGLKAHAEFAAAHGKQMSFPEWGLFRNGDNPDYVRGMHDWMQSHNVAYQTITDYCPHGVWSCDDNPRSAEVYRSLFGGRGIPTASPTVTPPDCPTPTPLAPASPAPAVLSASPSAPSRVNPDPSAGQPASPPAGPPGDSPASQPASPSESPPAVSQPLSSDAPSTSTPASPETPQPSAPAAAEASTPAPPETPQPSASESPGANASPLPSPEPTSSCAPSTDPSSSLTPIPSPEPVPGTPAPAESAKPLATGPTSTTGAPSLTPTLAAPSEPAREPAPASTPTSSLPTSPIPSSAPPAATSSDSPQPQGTPEPASSDPSTPAAPEPAPTRSTPTRPEPAPTAETPSAPTSSGPAPMPATSGATTSTPSPSAAGSPTSP
ncbi:glycoside hydrolase family 26 protein [Actinomadura hibisca]|uniref:glycoside hydrolase family 26 protein n=1 Tax=Actinomadura hibisca TaxID=68565 RepID=UPI0012F8751E|nr:glycosyl hydrolase [Actinomadura hibisca]